VWHGALAGALLTAPLIAVSYLGWIAAGLPFTPFDLFDWVARVLPGSVVTFGIETMVGIGRAFDVSSIGAAAKTGEQTAAIAGIFLLGVAGGAVFFALLRFSDEPALMLGAIVGGMLGGVTPEQETALQDYGFNLGVAFQLVDDLLDYTADAVALGKPVGGDLREGKVTLPIILLLRRGGETADSLIRGVVRDRAVSTEQWREILRLMREHRTTEQAYTRAVEYASRAKDSLGLFPPSREREALSALTDYVLVRDR